MLTYAVFSDLDQYIAPDDMPDQATADIYIAAASQLVRTATKRDRYDVDDAGKPSDPETLAVFTEATCLAVAEWVAGGIDPRRGLTGQELRKKSVSQNGVSWTFEDDPSINQRKNSTQYLCDRAMEVLRDYGLGTLKVGGAPWPRFP